MPIHVYTGKCNLLEYAILGLGLIVTNIYNSINID